MRDFEALRAEVYRRGEEKKRIKQRNQRIVSAVCVPLLLAGGLYAATGGMTDGMEKNTVDHFFHKEELSEGSILIGSPEENENLPAGVSDRVCVRGEVYGQWVDTLITGEAARELIQLTDQILTADQEPAKDSAGGTSDGWEITVQEAGKEERSLWLCQTYILDRETGQASAVSAEQWIALEAWLREQGLNNS